MNNSTPTQTGAGNQWTIPVRATFIVGSASESHWLVLTVH